MFFQDKNVKLLLFVTSITWSLSAVCSLVYSFQFTIDQSVGPSREELSIIIHWILLWITSGEWFVDFSILLYVQSWPDLLYMWLLLTLVIAWWDSMPIFWNKTTDLKFSKSNVEVLSYARKHAFLEQCSALTYWDDDYSSRIDLGRDKYGEPFLEEEEVKMCRPSWKCYQLPFAQCHLEGECGKVHSFIDLIPWFFDSFIDLILWFIALATMPAKLMSSSHIFISTLSKELKCKFVLIHKWTFIVWCPATLFVPIYHFLIYPILYNHVPSMLRRIRMFFFW